MKITYITITILSAGIALFLWVLLVDSALHKQELNECTEWTEQAKEFPETYFVTEWQYDQCEAVSRPLPEGFLRAK